MANHRIVVVAGRAAASALIAGLVACVAQPCAPAPDPVVQFRDVEKPVPVARAVPPELLACPAMPPGWKPPVYVKPDKCVSGDAHVCVKGDPAASSALTPDGEKSQQALVEGLVTCLTGWRNWATSPEPVTLPAAPAP